MTDQAKGRFRMTKSERMKRRAEMHRDLAKEVAGDQCEWCGGVHQLEFHHRDPSTKEFNVAQYFGRISWERIQVELEKCDVLCRECHITTFAKEYVQ